MAGLSTLQDLRNSLIRKTLNYSVFLGPYSADVVDETLFNPTTGAIASLPAGYLDVGYLTDDGSKFTKDITRQNTTSLQAATATRSDVTAGSNSITFEAQEARLATIGLYTDTATANLSPNSTSGVLKIDDPAIPSGLPWRLAAISEDLYEGLPVYIARIMPKAVVSKFNDQAFSKGDANTWGVTMDGLFDDVAGTAHRWLFGGEGWLALQSTMGFAPAIPVITGLDPTTLAVAGGDLLTITGRGFTGVTGAASVKIAGANATSYTVVDDSTIVAVSPAHTSGSGLPVVVTNSVGASTGGPTVTYA